MHKALYLTSLLTGFAIAPAVVAQERVIPMLNQGTKELALSGTVEFQKIDEIDFDIDAAYGYFVRDGWEIGVRVLGADYGGIERFDISAFTEYNFNRQSNIVPYIGTSVGVATFKYDGRFDSSTTLGDDGEATVFEVQAGIKWFLRPYMAISTSIGFNVSSDDIYAAEDDLRDNLTRFRIGLRYYF
ncbi:MAG: hypothetical protein Q7L19_13205 [Pseudohongiella sp.]|nr:hypothetical protein [Pseudohongiella sp.]